MSEPRYIPLSEPSMEGNAKKYLDECLETNFVSSVGPFVDRFEKEFAAWVGSKYAVACSTGTAAIHVAMRLFGVTSGDEVVVPTQTFIASANPVLYEKATALLVDSETESWNMDPDPVCDEIERRARSGARQIKMVEAVHLLGHPQKLDRLVETCAKHGVVLIEDASEALGARFTSGAYAGRHVGTIGALGCFSFNGNKIITTGGGGMITTDDPALAKRAKHLTTQARLPGVEYAHDEVGYNYRLTNVAAALGVAQLELLSDFVERKLAIARRYDEALRDVPGITLPPRAAWASPTMWLYTVLVEPSVYGCDRRELLARMEKARVQSRPIWSPLHTMPMYREAPRMGGHVAERLFARGLSLPCSVTLDPAAQQRAIDVIRARA